MHASHAVTPKTQNIVCFTNRAAVFELQIAIYTKKIKFIIKAHQTKITCLVIASNVPPAQNLAGLGLQVRVSKLQVDFQRFENDRNVSGIKITSYMIRGYFFQTAAFSGVASRFSEQEAQSWVLDHLVSPTGGKTKKKKNQ